MAVIGFPEGLGPVRRLLRELVELLEAGREDAWYAFATVSQDSRRVAVVANTESISVTCDRGVVLRITAGDCSHEWASNDLQPDTLRAGARALRARVEAAHDGSGPSYRPLSWSEEDLDDLHPTMRAQLPERLGPDLPVHFGTRAVEHPDRTPVAALAERARSTRAAVLARAEALGSPLATAATLVSQSWLTTCFVDRHKDMSQSLLSSYVRVSSVSRQGHQANVSGGGHGGLEQAVLAASQVDKAARLPGQLDGADRLAAGRYPVITSPEVTGVLAHEAFGHTQEGDTRSLGRSCATALQLEQRRVGPPGASIVSNAAVFGTEEGHSANGSLFFDDEGQLARPQRILDEGLVRSPMNDLMSALVGDGAGKAPRQCAGRRESWRRPLMARQTNTYFTPGDATLDELVSRVEHGYLAVDPSGGMEDPKGMSLTAGATYLEEIRGGRRTGRLFLGPSGGAIELSDPVPTILSGLLGKTREWRVSAGGCQKYHKEYLPAGVGGPWVLWEGITCG